MAQLFLRRTAPDDVETLFAIHRESAITAYAHVFPADRYAYPDEAMRAHWIAKLADEDATGMVAERGRRPVGFVFVSRGWLESLFVVPEEWRTGVGSALHDEAVELLKVAQEGARLWVLEQNEQARRFYEQRGWRHDGERARSEYPPYPATLRYTLDVGGGSDPSQAPTRPRG